ncbi:hypothetical protein RRG08_065870 [Elysia crispata]|uniref:Uncharacterized protein n=1 Tax=Elysia crispata TaxID=231223 RepID=A0AAE1A974_9GAST|nr:hypothetical protein RRG08_065870 [Elysia crispata]
MSCLRFNKKDTRSERKKKDPLAPIRDVWDWFERKRKPGHVTFYNSTKNGVDGIKNATRLFVQEKVEAVTHGELHKHPGRCMFGRISRLQNSETRTSIFKWEECPFGFHKECFFRIGRHLVRRSNIPTMSHYLKETIALTLGTLGAKKVPSKRPSSCPPSGEELPSKTLKMSAAPAPATSTSELKSTGNEEWLFRRRVILDRFISDINNIQPNIHGTFT